MTSFNGVSITTDDGGSGAAVAFSWFNDTP
jgi:hypothetical protein